MAWIWILASCVMACAERTVTPAQAEMIGAAAGGPSATADGRGVPSDPGARRSPPSLAAPRATDPARLRADAAKADAGTDRVEDEHGLELLVEDASIGSRARVRIRLRNVSSKRVWWVPKVLSSMEPGFGYSIAATEEASPHRPIGTMRIWNVHRDLFPESSYRTLLPGEEMSTTDDLEDLLDASSTGVWALINVSYLAMEMPGFTPAAPQGARSVNRPLVAKPLRIWVPPSSNVDGERR